MNRLDNTWERASIVYAWLGLPEEYVCAKHLLEEIVRHTAQARSAQMARRRHARGRAGGGAS